MQKCMGFFFVLAQPRSHTMSTKSQTLAQGRRTIGPCLRQEKPHAEMRGVFSTEGLLELSCLRLLSMDYGGSAEPFFG
jgi:hypothetical protein